MFKNKGLIIISSLNISFIKGFLEIIANLTSVIQPDNDIIQINSLQLIIYLIFNIITLFTFQIYEANQEAPASAINILDDILMVLESMFQLFFTKTNRFFDSQFRI